MTEEGLEMKEWIKKALVRAIKTAAQAAVAIIGTSVALGDVDWILTGSAAALAFVLSLLTSIAGIPEVSDGASVRQISKAADANPEGTD